MTDGDGLDRTTGAADAARRAFDAAPDMLASVVGPDLRVEAVNAACRAFLGRSDLVGLPLREAFPEATGREVAGMLERALATGEPQSAREWRLELALGGGSPREVFLDVDVAVAGGPEGERRLVMRLGDATARVRERTSAQRRAAGAERRLAAAHEVMGALQEALLPAELPVLPGLAVGARYLAAAVDQAAGGDWFDAVPRPDGTLALVVGDVAGHGVAASAAMGRGNAVLRELLVSEADPAAALRRLEAFAGRDGPLRGATVALAVADPSTGTIRHWSHGHPPPLIVSPDGGTRFLPAGGSSPLGVGGSPSHGQERLAPGESVLLYSDGLVERPGRTPQEGMDELARTAAGVASNRTLPAAAPGDPVDRLCRLTVELLTRTGYTDDVTVIACRRIADGAPAALDLEAPGTMADVTPLRHALIDWLRAVGASDEDRHVLELTVQEAMSNAVEHGRRGGRPDVLRLEAALGPDGWVECRISSPGPWREPAAADATRGRGLFVMHQLADEMRVTHPVQPAGAPAGARGTTVILRRRLRRPAVVEPARPAAAPPVEHGLALAVDESEEVPRVEVRGAVDGPGAAALAGRLAQVTRGGLRAVRIDLTEVSVLASAAVKVLHDLDARLAARGARLELVAPPDSAARMVLDLVGLGDRVVAGGTS